MSVERYEVTTGHQTVSEASGRQTPKWGRGRQRRRSLVSREDEGLGAGQGMQRPAQKGPRGGPVLCARGRRGSRLSAGDPA